MNKIKDKLKKWSSMTASTIGDLRTIVKLGLCSLCQTEERTSHLHSIDGHGYVCNDCYGELPKCDHCELPKVILNNGICAWCMSNKSIRSYSHKPYPVFHRIGKNGQIFSTDEKTNRKGKVQGHFGIENEIDCHSLDDGDPSGLTLQDSQLASVVSMIGNSVHGNSLYYVKEDSSLEVGAEIVSHPFSWRFWKVFGYDIYDTLFSVIRKAGYYSQETSTCGMHIHYTKDALSELTFYKMLIMVYMEESFMSLISQREESSLHSWGDVRPSSILGYGCPDRAEPRYNEKMMDALSTVARYKRAEDGRRGTAMNITSQTVEMRLFKGTINIMTFSKNIEFLRSLIMFCRDTSISDIKNKNRVKTFIHYLDNNQNRYPNLCWFLGHYAKEQAGVKGSFSQNKEKWNRKYLLEISKIDFFSDTKGVN